MQNGSFNLPVDSTSIHYSILGSGEPLLICPVTWGVDGHRWTTLEELAKDFALIRLDPRGTGKSGPAQEKTDYGIPILVNDIEQLRIHLGVDKWNVMGQSAGGWTALEFTLAHQSHVNKLIVVCSAPTGQFHKGTFRDPSHPFYPQYDQLSKEIRSLPHQERVKRFNRAIYQYDVQTAESRKTIDAIFADAEFDPKRNQYFIMNELLRYNVAERLKEISVPSLIIGGKHDVHVSPSWSRMMAENIPHASLVVMEHSGHFPWLDEPKIFFDSVRQFLER
ncbi:MAG: alpha/beta hydrolase [Ignavibacteriales bacterium]|nr:alpha/beta hydrolase [Ignavibacteriales bacterium]